MCPQLSDGLANIDGNTTLQPGSVGLKESKPNDSKLQKSSESVSAEEARRVAGLGLLALREMFPTRDMESDLAAKLRLEMMTDIVVEVGYDRFMAAVKKAISISRNRFDCSIFRIRECAGLQYQPPPSPAHRAWSQVRQYVTRHVRRHPEGGWQIEDFVYLGEGDKACVIKAPELPEATKRAVQTIGGWGALATTPDEFWSKRMADFIAVYEE